jgi:TonB family protein
MKICRFAFLLLLLASAFGEPLIIAGPFGVPLKVQDGLGNWTSPIRIYSDADIDIYIPDITSMAWKSWSAEQFRREGTFNIRLTMFYKTDKVCLSDLPPSQRDRPEYRSACRQMRYETEDVLVDMRRSLVQTSMLIAAEEDAVVHPEFVTTPKTVSPLSSFNHPTAVSIATVSTLVSQEIAAYTGPTAQEAIRHDSDIVARMSAAPNTEPVAGQPDTAVHADPLPSGRQFYGVADGSAANNVTLPTSAPVDKIGGAVSAPALLYSIAPEFTEKARKARISGNVLVNLWVDTNGRPEHVHVIRGVGMGLDEKAVEAVRQYRFKPAIKNGEPVLVELNVDVHFEVR